MKSGESGSGLFSVFSSKKEERTPSDLVFEKLYSQYFDSLVDHAVRYVEYRQIAEDIVQDLYSELWNRREEFKHLISPKSYFYQAVTNRALNYLRDYGGRISPLDTSEYNVLSLQSDDASPHDDAQTDVSEVYDRLMECIDELSPRAREVILYTLEGKTIVQIAQIMGVSTETVKTLKKRAYKMIRTSLELEIQ